MLLLSHVSHVRLCDPIDGSPPGSPVPGILQARTLEWVAISLSNAWKWKVKVKSLSLVRLLVTPWTAAYQAPPSMGFSRQEYWSGLPLTTASQLDLQSFTTQLGRGKVGRTDTASNVRVGGWENAESGALGSPHAIKSNFVGGEKTKTERWDWKHNVEPGFGRIWGPIYDTWNYGRENVNPQHIWASWYVKLTRYSYGERERKKRKWSRSVVIRFFVTPWM